MFSNLSLSALVYTQKKGFCLSFGANETFWYKQLLFSEALSVCSSPCFSKSVKPTSRRRYCFYAPWLTCTQLSLFFAWESLSDATGYVQEEGYEKLATVTQVVKRDVNIDWGCKGPWSKTVSLVELKTRCNREYFYNLNSAVCGHSNLLHIDVSN